MQRRLHVLRPLATVALAAVVVLQACFRPHLQPVPAPDPSRIVAVGDVHGGYDELVALLRAARVVNDRLQWSGGATRLVQTGDLVDRGPDSRKVMDLMMRLEVQAPAAGGQVHALLGNHEVMNLAGDLRYVSAGEYAAFATAASVDTRDRAFARLADPGRKNDPAYREAWEAEHPLGWAEHREAFAPTGPYGRWIRNHPALVKIDRYLFLHGGIAPSLSTSSMDQINRRVEEELLEDPPPRGGLAAGRDGPLWYRGLAQADERELRPHVEQLLARHDVDHIVVGHTTTPGAVLPRFGGAVLLIDVGLSKHYGARAACLVVERGTPIALHRGKVLRLPINRTGGLVPYLRAAAALDPAPSPLLPLIAVGGIFPIPNGADGPG